MRHFKETRSNCIEIKYIYMSIASERADQNNDWNSFVFQGQVRVFVNVSQVQANFLLWDQNLGQ